jgi:hypothetical protein
MPYGLTYINAGPDRVEAFVCDRRMSSPAVSNMAMRGCDRAMGCVCRANGGLNRYDPDCARRYSDMAARIANEVAGL